MPISASAPPSHIFFNIIFLLYSFRDLATCVKARCNPADCFPEDALGLHKWRSGWGCLFCWSVFNESDHAERVWPLAQQGPVITTSCFPFFPPLHYWTNNLWGEKCVYLPSSFFVVLFASAVLHFGNYWFSGWKITNRQPCKWGKTCKKTKKNKQPVKCVSWNNYQLLFTLWFRVHCSCCFVPPSTVW